MVYTPIMVHTNNMVHTPIIGLETVMLVKWCDCIACEGERAMFKYKHLEEQVKMGYYNYVTLI